MCAPGHFVSVLLENNKGVAKLEPSVLHFLSQYRTDLSETRYSRFSMTSLWVCFVLIFFIFLGNFLTRGLESGLQGEDSNTGDIAPLHVGYIWYRSCPGTVGKQDGSWWVGASLMETHWNTPSFQSPSRNHRCHAVVLNKHSGFEKSGKDQFWCSAGMQQGNNLTLRC